MTRNRLVRGLLRWIVLLVVMLMTQACAAGDPAPTATPQPPTATAEPSSAAMPTAVTPPTLSATLAPTATVTPTAGPPVFAVVNAPAGRDSLPVFSGSPPNALIGGGSLADGTRVQVIARTADRRWLALQPAEGEPVWARVDTITLEEGASLDWVVVFYPPPTATPTP